MYTASQIGIVEMTNLYLYGQTTKLLDLTSDAAVRAVGDRTLIEMDAVSFMATGAGRFANGTQMSVVSRFMDGLGIPAATGQRQVFSLSQALMMTGGSDRSRFQQYNYVDTMDGHAA